MEIKCRAQEELIWVVYNAGHEKIKNIRKWFGVNSVSFPQIHTDIQVYTALTTFKTEGALRTQGIFIQSVSACSFHGFLQIHSQNPAKSMVPCA